MIDKFQGKVVTIRRRVPSQNKSQYAHWSRYTKERDAWYVLLRSQLPPIAAIDYPVRLAIRSYRVRLLDYANLVGGAKPIPDSLIRLGYLKDDSPPWFRCSYEQFKVSKDDERSEIEFLSWDGLLGD
ncbi:MAG: hypothetical protein HRU15_07675 [Planctomycetes bacterium]|nr:hypothetical protein [Planctomycetota bacterium]